MAVNAFIFLMLAALAVGQDCPGGWDEREGFCYRVNRGGTQEPPLNWHDARTECMDQGGDLVSIESEEEKDYVLQLAESSGQLGNFWLGLNQYRDRNGPFEWSDGSDKDYTYYAANEPERDGTKQCIFSVGRAYGDCFVRHRGYNTIRPILSRPSDADDINTFYFGYFPAPDDVQKCENACRNRQECYTFTFISNSHPDPVWYGECTGRTNNTYANITDSYATSGAREACGDFGIWYSENCGRRYGYVCKKEVGSDTPIDPDPTEPVPGYCPEGWFAPENSNKCYKIVDAYAGFPGVSWAQALQACRSEEGVYQPDLASFHSREETAMITSQLQQYAYGYWIGYRTDSPGGSFYWSDNSNPDDWTYWAPGEPSGGNEYCVEIWVVGSPAGGWNDWICDGEIGYVCQSFKDPGNPIPDPPPTTAHNCLEGYTPYWYGCYKLVTTETSWAGGEQACAQDGGHLVSIHSQPENAAMVVASKGYTVWLGFRRGGGDEFMWTDGWPTRFDYWAEDEPGGDNACALMDDDDGYWYSEDCDEEYAYICKQTDVPRPTTPGPGGGACPSEEWVAYGNHCYYFAVNIYPDYESEPWGDALQECMSKSQGFENTATLVSFLDYQENEFVYKVMEEVREENGGWSPDEVWIGLSRKDLGSEFTWIDGNDVDYTLWEPGMPDDDPSGLCVEMRVDIPGLWRTTRCDEHKSFVCKVQMGPATEPPTTPPDEPGNCPTDDGTWDRYGHYCYLFRPDEYANWENALGSCKSQGGDLANLVSIESWHEDAWIHDMLFERSNMPVRRPAWIGFIKTELDAPWGWMEPDVDVTHTNWAAGHPNDDGQVKNCANIRTTDGFWESEVCTELAGYACRVRKTQRKKHVHESHMAPQLIGKQYPELVEVNIPENDGKMNENWMIAVSVVGGIVAIVCLVASLVIIKKTRLLGKHISASTEHI